MKKVDLSEMTEIDEAGNIIKPAEHRRETSSSAEPKAQRIYEADEKENLVSRAAKRKKHKNHTYGKGRVKKVVMSLILALSATFLALTGCTTDTTDPGKNPSTNPGTNPGTNPTEYSQLVTDLANDTEVNALIDQANQNTSLFSTPLFDPHPYSFLEKEGLDVEAIKSGELYCRTISFVRDDEPNNLYMITYAENEGAVPYYSEYMLKYSLTDKEMADYNKLHDEEYIQAVFLNDAISEAKAANVISETKMTVEAHTNLSKSLRDNDNYVKNAIDTDNIDILLKDYSTETGLFNVYIFQNLNMDSNMLAQNKKIVKLQLTQGTTKITINNDIFYGPHSSGQYRPYIISEETPTYEDYLNSVVPITFYSSQGTILNENLDNVKNEL